MTTSLSIFFIARLLSRIRYRTGDFIFTLYKSTLLAHLDLNRACLAARIRLLDDLGGLLASERDLVLRFRRTMRFAQILEQASLVLFG